jgi:hypothetical protein
MAKKLTRAALKLQAEVFANPIPPARDYESATIANQIMFHHGHSSADARGKYGKLTRDSCSACVFKRALNSKAKRARPPNYGSWVLCCLQTSRSFGSFGAWNADNLRAEINMAARKNPAFCRNVFYHLRRSRCPNYLGHHYGNPCEFCGRD